MDRQESDRVETCGLPPERDLLKGLLHQKHLLFGYKAVDIQTIEVDA